MTVCCPDCGRTISEAVDSCPRCGAVLPVPLRLNWLARLFWACPVCRNEAPLVGQQPFFGEASLVCRACHATWRFDPATAALILLDARTRQPRETRALADWLALLPPPFTGRALPAPGLLLAPGERCLVRVEPVRMLTPRQATYHARVLGRIEILPGVFERVTRDPYGPSPAMLATVARGVFFVTDRRAVFMGNRKQVEIPYKTLTAIEVDEGFLIVHRAARTDTFGFERERAVRIHAALLAIQAGAPAPPPAIRQPAATDPGDVAGASDPVAPTNLAPTPRGVDA